MIGNYFHPDLIEGRCSRCRELIKDYHPPEPTFMTAGYYWVNGWKDLMNEGEEIICDTCMWADDRYIAIYGDMRI